MESPPGVGSGWVCEILGTGLRRQGEMKSLKEQL